MLTCAPFFRCTSTLRPIHRLEIYPSRRGNGGSLSKQRVSKRSPCSFRSVVGLSRGPALQSLSGSSKSGALGWNLRPHPLPPQPVRRPTCPHSSHCRPIRVPFRAGKPGPLSDLVHSAVLSFLSHVSVLSSAHAASSVVDSTLNSSPLSKLPYAPGFLDWADRQSTKQTTKSTR